MTIEFNSPEIATRRSGMGRPHQDAELVGAAVDGTRRLSIFLSVDDGANSLGPGTDRKKILFKAEVPVFVVVVLIC